MNEYLQQYLDGKIDYATYLQYASSTPSTDNSFLNSLSKINKKEQITGTGSTGDLSKSFNMDAEELETYTSRGITPTFGSDYEDTRAEFQGWDEQLANGLTKFAGKTATGIVGGLAMLPGLAYGLATGSFTNVYDNAFQRSLDDANAAMDEALPNYVTREEEKNNVLESLGTMNFWANDALGAASFVVGAIGTELLSAGIASAMIPGKVAKSLKALSYADEMGKIGMLSNKAKNINNVYKGLTLGRQVVTGAGYEAGVEARGFIDEAESNFISKFQEENNREPNDQELAAAMDEIRSSANGLFAANLALVSASNIIALPRFFGPGIKTLKNPNSKWLSNVDELSDDQLARVAKTKGISVEDVKKLKTVNKFDTFSKGRKALSYGYQALEKPVMEGLVEEGGQSFMNKTALDYIDAKLFNDTTEDTASIVDSMAEGFKETYGGDSNDFWKEVFIGSLMGGITGFKLPNKKAKTGFGYDVTNYSKDSEVNQLVDLSNSLKYSKDVFASANRQAQLNNRLENAIAVGDDFEAKNTEDQIMHDFVTNKIKLGQFDQIEDEVAKEVSKMTDEEFAAEYGYENLSKEELSKRKSEVVGAFVKNAKSIQASYANANRANNTGNQDVTDSLSYVLYMGDRIDSRETGIAKNLQEKIGKIYDTETLKDVANYVGFVKDATRDAVVEYKDKIKQLEELTKKELLANKNRTSEEIMARGKEMEAIEKDIIKLQENLDGLYKAYLKDNNLVGKGESIGYDRDSQNFKNVFDVFTQVQRDAVNTVGEDFYDRKDISEELSDLRKLSSFRESQITTANYFFTQEGQKTLESQINRLKLLKEQGRVTEELNKAAEVFNLMKQDYIKMKELAVLSYSKKAADIGATDTQTVEAKIDATTQFINTLGNSPETDLLKEALRKVQEKIAKKDISNIEKELDAIYTDLFNKLDNLKYKNELSLIDGLFKEITFYMKGARAESVLETYKRLFKVYIPDDWNSKEWLGKNNINISQVTFAFKEIPNDDPYVKKAEENNRIAFAKDFKSGQPILTNYIGVEQLIKIDGKYYSVVLKHGEKEIGYILDPNRYKFKTVTGYEDFNPKSLAHLRLLNPTFVDKAGEVTKEGKEFIAMYTKGVQQFNIIKEAISKGVKKFTNAEVKEYFDVRSANDFSTFETTDNNNLIEQILQNPEQYNVIPKNSEEGIEIEPGKFLITSFLTYYYGGNAEYFYFDKDTKTFKKLEYGKGIAQLEKYLRVGDKGTFNKNSTGLKVVIPNDTDFPYAFTVKLPAIPSDNSLIKEMVTAIAAGEKLPKLNFTIYMDDMSNESITVNLVKTKNNKLKIIAKNSKTGEDNWFDLGDADKFSPGTIEDLLALINKKISIATSFTNKYLGFKVTGVNKVTYGNIDSLQDILQDATLTIRTEGAATVSPRIKKDDKSYDEIFNKKKPTSSKEETINFNDEDAYQPTAEETSGLVESGIDFGDITLEPTVSEPAPVSENIIIDNLSTENNIEDDPENIAFKITDEEVDYEESLDSRIANIQSMLPSSVPIEDIKEIASKLNNTGFTYGAFIDGIIYLAKNSPKGVEYHEAFHAVFRTLLKPIQIAKAYAEARKKYGIPTKQQLDALQKLSPLYSNLTKDELEKLWLEEQMADDFQKINTTPKTFLEKMFDKIRQFINWVRGNKSYLDGLFSDIQSGKYAKADKVGNQPYLFKKPAFKALVFEEKYGDKVRKRALTGKMANTLLNNLKGAALKLSQKKIVTDVDIKNIINEFKNKYYTEEYQRERLGDAFNNPNVQRTVNKNISQLRNVLSNESNVAYIVKEIKAELNSLRFQDYSLTEDEDSSDMPTELMAKETSELGGFEGISKEMKKYLTLVPVTTDEFGLGIEVKNSDYISFVDPYQLYNHVVRILASRKASDILPAFFYQSRMDNKLMYLRNKLFNDIAQELKLENVTAQEIATLPLSTLAKSGTFNMFVANFRKNKLDFISITPDVEKNKVKVFRSNINDVKDVQYNEWANNSLIAPTTVEEKSSILSKLKVLFSSDLKFIKTIKEFNDRADEVDSLLKKLGITLSKEYIKLSLFNAHPNKEDLASLDVNNIEGLNQMSNLLSVYSDLNYLDSALFTAMNLSKTPTLFTTDSSDSRSSNVGEIKKIAESNSYFDFNVIPTVFKNIEGKTIYSYIQPNFVTDIINIMTENSSAIFDIIKSDYDEGLKNFKVFLADNNMSSNDFLEEEYYRALKFNPILAQSTNNSFLLNLETFLLDGSRVIEMDENFNELTYKREDEGSTFQQLDPRGKLLTYFYLYSKPGQTKNSRNSIGKTIDKTDEYVPYIPFQNEGKNTQYAVLMPKRENLVGDKLSNQTKEILYNVFASEFDNLSRYFKRFANNETIEKIKGVTEFKNRKLQERLVQAIKNKNIEDVLDIYKNEYSSLPRILKFSNIEVLFKKGLLDELITKAVNNEELTLEDTDSLSEELVNDLTAETLDLLASPEIRLITKVDDDYTNVLLPTSFLDSKTNNLYVDKNKVKNFVVDDYINSLSLMNLFVGNLTSQFKDAIDLPKRMAGLNASGPSLGNDNSKVTIINDVEGVFTDIVNGKVFDKERTDGQSYSTQTWYENKYLKTFNKWNPRIENIYKKIRKAEKLSWSEKELLENFGALTNSRKISLFNYSIYGKTSVNPLTRNEVSYVKEKDKQAVSNLVDRLYSTTDSDEYASILKELHGYYQPLPHARKMHYLLNSMEQSSVDLALSESAVKTLIYNTQTVTGENQEFESFTLGDTFIREQVNTDGMKTKIIDGTQLLQLIDSEQDFDTEVVINIGGVDKTVKVGDVVRAFKNSKAYRVREKYKELKQSYAENNKPRYKALLKSFRESLEQMGTDPIIREMMSESENLDLPKYNLNMTRTLFQVEKMLYAYLGDILSHKVTGGKFTLLTDDAYKVVEDSNGKIITMEEFKNSPIENYTTRDLEVKYNPKTKTWEAETVISAQTAYRYGLKPGNTVEITDKKLLEYIGTRIPTQDKSSMVVMKIVDYLPVEKGNTVILPFETMFFSGADFDIDSLFAQTFATYNDNNKEKIFGNYLYESNADARLEKAFKEYREYYSQVKSVKADYDRFLENDAAYNAKLEEREYTEKLKQLALIQDKDDMLAFIRSELNPEAENEIIDFYKEVVKNSSPEKALLTTLNYVRQNFTKEFTKEQIETAREIEASIKKFKEKNLNIALNRNKYASTLEEFKQQYSKQVNQNYNAIKNSIFSEYEPLTKSETDNFMLELKKVLIRNEGNNSSSLRNVERDIAAALTKRLEEMGIKDSTKVSHYLSLASKAKMSIANAIGGKNIGVAALGSIMAQYLINANANIEGYGKLNTFKFSEDVFINQILSLWITLGVDNAKHQDAGRFSINQGVQSAFVIDAIANQGNNNYTPEHILALGLVPRVKQMINEMQFLNESFKTKKEKDLETSKSKILEAYSQLPENKKAWEDYTIDEILTNIKRIQDGEVLPDFEKAAASKLTKLIQVADYTIPFTQLMSVIKGNKSTSAENLQVLDALDSLGLKMTPSGLEHTDKYYYQIENDPASHPIDFLQVINSNTFLEEEISTFYKIIMEDVGMFLIPMSKDGSSLIKDISNNLKKRSNTKEKLNRLIQLSVNSMAFYAQRKIAKELGKSEIPTSYYLSETEDETQYIKDFKTLKSFEGLKDNFILKNLDFTNIQGKDGSPISNKYVQKIITNFRLNMSPEMKQRMSDDMFSLYAGEVNNPDGTQNQEIAKVAMRFTATLVNQLWQADSGLFLNQSVLPYTEPFFLANHSAALDLVQQAIAGNKTYEEVFGLSKENLFKEIKENYLRDYNNLIDVSGNNINFVKNNIKRSLVKQDYFNDFLNKFKNTSDSQLKQIIQLLEKIKQEVYDKNAPKLKFDEIAKISPITFSQDNSEMVMTMVPSWTDVSSAEAKKLLKQLYRNALADTGLTKVTYKRLENGNIILNHEFLDYLVMTIPKQENGETVNERVIYKLKKLETYKDYPLKATYEKVNAFGSKLFMHYYRTPSENEAIYSPVIKTSKVLPSKALVEATPIVLESNTSNYYQGDIKPEPNTIFVFGSNPEGRHGLGAAKTAREKFGAIYGQGEGLQGNSYALPTKDLRVKENNSLKSIDEETIINSIKKLYQVAKQNPTKQFKIAYRNTTEKSLNGYTGLEMIAMFNKAGVKPGNIIFSKEWVDSQKSTVNSTSTSTTNLKFTKGLTTILKQTNTSEAATKFLLQKSSIFEVLDTLNTKKYLQPLMGVAENILNIQDDANLKEFLTVAQNFVSNKGIETMKKCKL